jgi:hypothetical protein
LHSDRLRQAAAIGSHPDAGDGIAVVTATGGERSMKFMRLLRGTSLVLLAIVMLLIGIWCSIAIWYQCRAGEPLRGCLTGATASFTVIAVAGLATRWRWIITGIYSVSVAAFLAWWAAITPSNDRRWAADVARNLTATIDGDRVVINNVRNFAWRSDVDFDEHWEQRTYSLSHVTDVDLIMSYWMGEAIAHTLVSFGFDNGERLAFSIETRKEAHEGSSSIAGLFKQYELAIVAADERDVVRLRSNIRGEDVRIYRLRMTPSNAQRLLREYLEEANDLARTPRFYNTLTSNCTTLVFDMVVVIHPGLPLDARVILAGYLPNYAYAVGGTDTSISFEKLRELSRIHDNAARADADPNFSARIREGIPVPH